MARYDDDDRRPARAPRRGRYRDDYDDDYDRPRRRFRDDGPRSTSGLAITSLVCALLGFMTFGVLSLPALVTGILALISIRNSNGEVGGRGLAWAGLLCGVLALPIPAGMSYLMWTSYKEAEKEALAANNLSRVGAAVHSYHDTQGQLPSASIATRDGKPGLSWRVAILPDIGERALYEEFHLDEPWDSPHNIKLLDRMPALYRSPKDPEGTTDTPYRVFAGREALFSEVPQRLGAGAAPEGQSQPERRRFTDVTDGTSNTFMIVETAKKVPWTKPDELESGPGKALPQFGYMHQERFHAVMADGSVRVLYSTESPQNIRNAVTRNGGEVVMFDSDYGPRRR